MADTQGHSVQMRCKQLLEKERDQALQVQGFVLCSIHSPGPALRANLINSPASPSLGSGSRAM